MLTLYEKLDDAPYFRKGKSFTIYEHPSRITNITITPLEESLICSLETNQMFILPLAQADILKTEEMNFEHMYQPFHAGVRRFISMRSFRAHTNWSTKFLSLVLP